MNNPAKQDDMPTSDHLADREISRVLSALKKAGFKKSETGNAAPDQTFKPRSLMEIAAAAREAEVLKNASAEAEAYVVEASDDEAHGAEAEMVDATQGDISNIETNMGEVPKPHPEQQPQPEQQAQPVPELSPEVPSAEELKAQFETAQQAHDRGHAAGVEVGRSSTEAELTATITASLQVQFAEKIAAFEGTLASLTKYEVGGVDALSRSLQAAVLEMASARAGLAITDLPESFITKIDGLADNVGKKLADGKLFLNAEDYMIIAPILKERGTVMQIAADPGLKRGDIRLNFGGIEIEDLVQDKIDLGPPKIKTKQEVSSLSEVSPEQEVSSLSEVSPEQEVSSLSEVSPELEVSPISEVSPELEVFPISEVSPKLEVFPLSEVSHKTEDDTK